MSIALFELGRVLVIGLLLVAVLASATVILHEGSHWLVARFWTRAVSIKRWHGIFPHYANYESPLEIPPHAIRLSGIAPLILNLPPAILLFTVLREPLAIRILLTLPFWFAALMVSPGDLLATFYPETFREYANETDSLNHTEALRILLAELGSW